MHFYNAFLVFSTSSRISNFKNLELTSFGNGVTLNNAKSRIFSDPSWVNLFYPFWIYLKWFWFTKKRFFTTQKNANSLFSIHNKSVVALPKIKVEQNKNMLNRWEGWFGQISSVRLQKVKILVDFYVEMLKSVDFNFYQCISWSKE